MTVSQPVERVIAALREASYEPLPRPVAVAGIPFDFAAVLVANTSLDLVVIIDTITDDDAVSVRRRVDGLSRALDLVESRRPLTVILVGPGPVPELQLALTRVARVLVAGVPEDERGLRDAISILLPLKRVAVAATPDSVRSAQEGLLAAHADAVEIFDAAKLGPEEVAQVARQHLLGATSREAGNS